MGYVELTIILFHQLNYCNRHCEIVSFFTVFQKNKNKIKISFDDFHYYHVKVKKRIETEDHQKGE